MKKFVKENLDEITATVRREYNEINKLIQNKNLLNSKYEKNKKNSEWMEIFIKEVDSLLEI